MVSGKRLFSIAAGVTPELAGDPVAFVRAAVDAGWPATGIWYEPDEWTVQTQRTLSKMLADTGIIPLDIEVVWLGGRGSSQADHGEAVIDAAAALGVRNILTVANNPDPAWTAERLAGLCTRAAPAGIRICLEFMRFTAVKSLADAIDIVNSAGEPNAGVLVDLLHLDRSRQGADGLAGADPHLFPYVQWCDGPAEPRGWDTADLVADAVDDRVIPGHGDLDAQRFEQLFDTGVPFSLEVRSAALRRAFPDPTERARHLWSQIRR